MRLAGGCIRSVWRRGEAAGGGGRSEARSPECKRRRAGISTDFFAPRQGAAAIGRSSSTVGEEERLAGPSAKRRGTR